MKKLPEYNVGLRFLCGMLALVVFFAVGTPHSLAQTPDGGSSDDTMRYMPVDPDFVGEPVEGIGVFANDTLYAVPGSGDEYSDGIIIGAAAMSALVVAVLAVTQRRHLLYGAKVALGVLFAPSNAATFEKLFGVSLGRFLRFQTSEQMWLLREKVDELVKLKGSCENAGDSDAPGPGQE